MWRGNSESGVRCAKLTYFGLLVVGSLSLFTDSAGGETPGVLAVHAMTCAPSYFRFEANQSQTEDRVHFLGRGTGYDLLFLSDEVVLRLHTAKTEQPIVRMRFIGASAEAKITGLEELQGKSNYFLGARRDAWHTRIR